MIEKTKDPKFTPLLEMVLADPNEKARKKAAEILGNH